MEKSDLFFLWDGHSKIKGLLLKRLTLGILPLYLRIEAGYLKKLYGIGGNMQEEVRLSTL